MKCEFVNRQWKQIVEDANQWVQVTCVVEEPHLKVTSPLSCQWCLSSKLLTFPVNINIKFLIWSICHRARRVCMVKSATNAVCKNIRDAQSHPSHLLAWFHGLIHLFIHSLYYNKNQRWKHIKCSQVHNNARLLNSFH